MNGRVYDPMLGRFGTPDPMTEDPYNSQGWNRYTYVGNSPLNATDPSGYCWKGCFWQKPFKALGKLLRKFPIIGQIIQVAASAICIASVVCARFAPAVAGLASAITTGLASGNLGMALKAGFIATATALAMQGVGDITGHTPDFGSPEHFANIAGHAAVGCGSAVASGGKCGPGALSGAVGSFATPLTEGLSSGARLIAVSAAGGLASVAGGGKFGNGAITAAFGYLFNQMAGDAVLDKLNEFANQAVQEFDALGDAGFSEAQLNAQRSDPWLRPMQRGYNIDARVRDMVANDPELSTRLDGKINGGIDFTDNQNGKRYEMTTKGQFQAKQSKYGPEPFDLIDTGRRLLNGFKGPSVLVPPGATCIIVPGSCGKGS